MAIDELLSDYKILFGLVGMALKHFKDILVIKNWKGAKNKVF